MFAMVHRRAYVHGLADAMGLPLPDVSLPSGTPLGTEPFIESLLTQLRDVVVARTDDQVVSETAKDMARVLKYLKLRHRLEHVLAEDELRDLAGVLGDTPVGVTEGRAQLLARIESDAIDDATMIGVLWRRVFRETAMMAEAMGALAERVFPPLTD
jgi:hypothetical protein